MGWHQRVELPRVARHMVSSGAAQKPVAPFLCRALRDGRAQQQLLSASPTGAAPALGGRCAGGVPLCCQSPTPQITHEQRLQHCDELVREFLQRITLLGKRLGPILWQLPPNLPWHPGVLEQFLALLPESLRYAVEFRHPSWDRLEVWELLRSRGIATVWSSSLRYPLFLQATADFLYLRFHGLHGGFAHRYTREELLPWVERVCTALRQGMSVYAYFNNTAGGAPEDAAHFRTLVLQHL